MSRHITSTAVALVLALGAAPLAAQTDGGESEGSSETEASTTSEETTDATVSGSPKEDDAEAAMASDDAARIELGTLTCELAAVTNVIVYAEESFDCVLETNEGEMIAYEGNIEKIGANLQIKTAQTLKWIVLSSVSMDEPEDLSGSYFGASAQASLGVGGGANVLVGGSGDNFTLQPISVTGQEGLGASLTLDSLTLSRAAM
ncbi:MAG TPA: DUF992 domain-containing protein [Thermohalobaculum sp.]|nr:DUF992 domain-containing protein [Thermohalobaculum sp.]